MERPASFSDETWACEARQIDETNKLIVTMAEEGRPDVALVEMLARIHGELRLQRVLMEQISNALAAISNRE